MTSAFMIPSLPSRTFFCPSLLRKIINRNGQSSHQPRGPPFGPLPIAACTRSNVIRSALWHKHKMLFLSSNERSARFPREINEDTHNTKKEKVTGGFTHSRTYIQQNRGLQPRVRSSELLRRLRPCRTRNAPTRKDGDASRRSPGARV